MAKLFGKQSDLRNPRVTAGVFLWSKFVYKLTYLRVFACFKKEKQGGLESASKLHVTWCGFWQSQIQNCVVFARHDLYLQEADEYDSPLFNLLGLGEVI